MTGMRALCGVALLWALCGAVVHAQSIPAAERAIAAGEYPRALSGLAPLVKRGVPRAIVLTGHVHALRGERAEAERAYRALIALYNDDKIRDDDGEGMWAVAEAARALGSFRDANEAFARAVKASPKNLDIEVAWADLFLEKYDAGNAETGLKRVLEAQPSHARALERMARVRMEQGTDFAAVEQLLTKALAHDPKLTQAFVTRAGMALRDGDLAAADRHLDAALKHNPRDLESLSVRAAVRFVADDREGFERAVEKVLKENPRFSRLYSIVGTYAEWEHRYEELVELAARALAIDGEDPLAHAMRALNLLRIGKEQEGLKALEAAWARDRYNVHVFNTLNLYEDVIAKEYESFEAKPFRLRMHKEERRVLEPYAMPMLARAYADMKARYAFTPEGPISIELYANPEHFSVRTVGLPQLGVQGVCFGKVLTALSPRGGEFNWGQILWHELSHVFHVQRSKSRVPRWFTEGLAEYETTRARPEWRREDDRALWDALEASALPKLSAMNHAFTHAQSPADLMVAYYASSVAVTYVVERFGFEVVPRMLDAWRLGAPTDQVFTQILGVDLDTLDRDFRAALRARLAPRYERDLRIDISKYGAPETLRANAERALASAHDRGAYALALAVSGAAERADSLAQAVLNESPSEPLALFARVHIALTQGDLEQAQKRLLLMLERGLEGHQLRMLLARTELKRGKPEAALVHLDAAARLDPDRGEAFELMGEVAEKQNDTARLEQALARYSFLDQHARAPLARLLALLEARGAYKELAARAEAGLYLDPESSALHRQLALSFLHEKTPREALVEVERALVLAQTEEDKAKARALRDRITKAKGAGARGQPPRSPRVLR